MLFILTRGRYWWLDEDTNCHGRLSSLCSLRNSLVIRAVFRKLQPYVQYTYVILPYVYRRWTSLYNENKLCKLLTRFTKNQHSYSTLAQKSILANANNKKTTD